MRKLCLALPFFFLFLFLSIPTLAYEAINLNATLPYPTSSNLGGMGCFNSSIDNKIYCHIAIQTTNTRIYRVNETLTTGNYCSYSSSSTITGSLFYSENKTCVFYSNTLVCLNTTDLALGGATAPCGVLTSPVSKPAIA